MGDGVPMVGEGVHGALKGVEAGYGSTQEAAAVEVPLLLVEIRRRTLFSLWAVSRGEQTVIKSLTLFIVFADFD